MEDIRLVSCRGGAHCISMLLSLFTTHWLLYLPLIQTGTQQASICIKKNTIIMNSNDSPPIRTDTEETRTEQENGGGTESKGQGSPETFPENRSSFLEKLPPEGYLGPQGEVGFSPAGIWMIL